MMVVEKNKESDLGKECREIVVKRKELVIWSETMAEVLFISSAMLKFEISNNLQYTLDKIEKLVDSMTEECLLIGELRGNVESIC
jgi:hypothetical protein